MARIIRVHQNQADRWNAEPGLTAAQRAVVQEYEAAIGDRRGLIDLSMQAADDERSLTVAVTPADLADATFDGARVGAGNSAVQVGYELSQVATVSLATRHPVIFVPQCRGGKDVHYWLQATGFGLLPPEWLRRYFGGRTVDDTGKYQHALETGQLDRRPMFTAFEGDSVIWPDGTREHADTVLFATGYRPHLDYLSPLGVLDGGMPRHSGGISATHPGLVYVGLEFQGRSPPTPCAAFTGDTEQVIGPLVAHVRNAPATVGL